MNYFPDWTLSMATSRVSKKGAVPIELDYTVTSFSPQAYYRNAQVYGTYNGTKQHPSVPMCGNIFTNEGGDWTEDGQALPYVDSPNLFISQNALHNAALRTAFGRSTLLVVLLWTGGTLLNLCCAAASGPGGNGDSTTGRWIMPRLAVLPVFKFVPVVNTASIDTQAFMFPLLTLFLLPPFVAAITFEKERRLFQVLQLALATLAS